jgi:penicillin-binding protein 4
MPKKSNHSKTKVKKSNKINKSNKTKKNRARKGKGHFMKLALQLLTVTLLLAVTIVIFYFYMTYGKTIFQLQSEAKKKVSKSTEDTFRSVQTSLVYDSKGNLISSLKAEKDVYYLKYEEIPTIAVEAMIISEDRKFLDHNGVDYWANIRAAISLIKHRGKIKQGASTITQQLARNVFLTHEVTYERKIEEIFIAQELEKKYSKFDILEFYLNEIYFANGHYGIQAAAQAYFDEGASTLSLSQIAFLCAIPNNPSLYDPLTHMDKTLKRRDRILLQLYEGDKISTEEYKKALSEKIVLKQRKSEKINYVETYVYFSTIRALMTEKGFEFRYQFEDEAEKESYDEAYQDMYYSCQKDLYIKGYRIYTSIDLEKQELLQKTVDETLKGFTEMNEEGVYRMQGAAVCIDNDTGKVIAIVGGRDQDLSGYTLNRGYQSYRQPGSAIKPLVVYTPAFERNYTPESDVLDEYKKDGPRNSGNSYAGEMKLQRAIEVSKNTIAWDLFEELTPQIGLSYLIDMNFSKISERDYVPAASLGGLTIGASPLEMAAAYATLENDGIYREPTCIVKISDAEGNEVVDDPTDTKQVYQVNAAKIMTEALTGVMKNGTAKGLSLSHTVSAGKTGTTNDKKDGWFVGYTPYYTTSVWVGYDIPKTVDNLKGSTYPGTIWHDFMEKIHTSAMNKKFELYDWRSLLEEEEDEELEQDDLQEVPVDPEELPEPEDSVNDEENTDISEEDMGEEEIDIPEEDTDMEESPGEIPEEIPEEVPEETDPASEEEATQENPDPADENGDMQEPPDSGQEDTGQQLPEDIIPEEAP